MSRNCDGPIWVSDPPVESLLPSAFLKMHAMGTNLLGEARIARDKKQQRAPLRNRQETFGNLTPPIRISRAHDNHASPRQRFGGSNRIDQTIVIGHEGERRQPAPIPLIEACREPC